MSATVLITGGSGFIGSHCIVQALAAGYQVRTTVRKLDREPQVRAMLREGGADPGDQLRFFAADLEQDAGWKEAVAGCDYVRTREDALVATAESLLRLGVIKGTAKPHAQAANIAS